MVCPDEQGGVRRLSRSRLGHTLFRLETLPAYDVDGAEAKRFAAFREGGPRPMLSGCSTAARTARRLIAPGKGRRGGGWDAAAGAGGCDGVVVPL